VPELRVRRDDVAVCELAEGESPDAQLEDGEAQLRIERFALSTNNATYAQTGDSLGYWRVFPAPDGWGRVPAWGYARVERSRAPGVEKGQRVFGMVPMGSHVTVRPQATPFGFVDDAAHRSDLNPVYNRYLVVDGEGDDAELVMRPLFATAVVLDLVLGDELEAAILTSASSKTAYSLAHLLRRRSVQTIGLTSEGNRDWVEGLGLYDRVLSYGDAGEVEASTDGTVLVDFAGDPALVRALHERLGDALRRSISVGFTHRRPDADEQQLPGPAPTFFFAPDEMVRREGELFPHYVETWPEFARVLERTMRIERVAGADGLVAVYRELIGGRVDPAIGYVVAL
jgi:hypothetical protein